MVIGVGDDWEVTSSGQVPRDWLVVNLLLRPDNLGGPILDSSGRLVDDHGRGGVGMAVPSHIASRLVGSI
jgi:hypothetical protein